MRVAPLVSTGKDSTYAMQLAARAHDVVALGAMVPSSEDSWMFHRPTRDLLNLFARATDTAIVIEETAGEKEKELDDLRRLLTRLKELGAEGIVTGAVASTYQRTRVEDLCDDLGLHVLSPLWGKDGAELLEEMLDAGMEIMVVKTAARGLGEEWLGRVIDRDALEELKELNEEHGVHVAGEGGEYETLTLASPLFRGRIEVQDTEVRRRGSAYELVVTRARFVPSPAGSPTASA